MLLTNNNIADTKKPLQYYATASVSSKLAVKLVTLIDPAQNEER